MNERFAIVYEKLEEIQRDEGGKSVEDDRADWEAIEELRRFAASLSEPPVQYCTTT